MGAFTINNYNKKCSKSIEKCAYAFTNYIYFHILVLENMKLRGELMNEYTVKNLNIYVSEKLYILEKVDKEDHIYYPGDDILFTIICINNSDEKLDNILLRDILPLEVLPINGGYEVSVTKGEIKQKANIVEVTIDSILPKEAIKLTIKGRVSA